MAHNVKSIRKQFHDQGVFYTDESQAMKMKSYLPDDIDEVYDPTCGDGGLLRIFPDEVRKYGQELDPNQLKVAEDTIPNFIGAVGDTLENPAFMDRKFRYIMANYPFSQKWNPEGKETDPRFSALPTIPTKGNADFAFLAHILYMLADDGIAVVMNFPGAGYRGNREGKIRQWMIEQNYVERVVYIEGGTFVDTAVPTVLWIIKKNRQKTDIIFENCGKTEVVSFEKVRENKFNLSPSTYVIPEDTREKIDIVETTRQARAGMLKRFEAELKFEQTVAALQGEDIRPLFDKLQAILDRYRNPSEERQKELESYRGLLDDMETCMQIMEGK